MIAELGGGKGIAEVILNDTVVWRNLDHSHELLPLEQTPELDPAVTALLDERLKEGTPIVALYHAGKHKHVFYNKFKLIERGHLYFPEYCYGGRYKNRRCDKQAYPYDCRDRMAVPWRAVSFLFFAKEAPFQYSGGYAGMRYFTEWLRDDAGASQKEAAQTIRGLLEWQSAAI